MADSETHKLKLKTVDHIGIHVRDCEKVIETWERMFGIGPWAIREMSSKTPEGKTLTTKLAFAYTDNGVELEMIQPPEGSTTFIDTHGEGLHHWGFFADDVDGEAAKLVERGAKIVQQKPGQWIYLDCGGPGGVIFELMRRRGRITDG
jgi:predicted enzyme related to lactoylglutathione lyase